LSVNLVRGGQNAPVAFEFGPVGHLRLDRSARIEDPVVRALGKIGRAVELGGYAGIKFNRLLDPYDSLSIRATVTHDVSGIHRSTIWAPGIDYMTPVSTRTLVVLSAQADRVGDRYARTYFSITPAQSLRSGLPVYGAHGGWKNYRLSLLVAQVLTGDLRRPRHSLFAGVSYSRELGNLARAPIVAIRGNPNQYVATAGFAYSF
jgi:outer membrane protein